MIVDKYLKNFGNNQVFAVVHSRVIWRSVLPIFVELCMKTPCLCPSEGHLSCAIETQPCYSRALGRGNKYFFYFTNCSVSKNQSDYSFF